MGQVGMVRLSQRTWVRALVLAVVILSALFGAMVFLLNVVGYIATAQDLASPGNSSVRSVVLFLLSGKWWMYFAALVAGLIALVVIYELDARRNPDPANGPSAEPSNGERLRFLRRLATWTRGYQSGYIVTRGLGFRRGRASPDPGTRQEHHGAGSVLSVVTRGPE
jgi:hypothetical protein